MNQLLKQATQLSQCYLLQTYDKLTGKPVQLVRIRIQIKELDHLSFYLELPILIGCDCPEFQVTISQPYLEIPEAAYGAIASSPRKQPISATPSIFSTGFCTRGNIYASIVSNSLPTFWPLYLVLSPS